MSTLSNSYFLWEVEGKPVSILVNLDAIDRLENTVAKDPKMHGILYGRVDQLPGKRCILVIERLEHHKDLQRVGYYRTTDRPDLSIGDSELASVRRYLFDPASVLLLIRPNSDFGATAGFFVWENGTMQSSSSYREFPLNRKSLESQGLPILQHPAAREASVIQAVRDPEPAVQPKHTALRWNSWMWVPIALALLILIPALSRRRPAGVIGAAPSVTQFGQPTSLDLNAQKSGQSLRVTWNRANPAILDAERGVLWIKDNGREQRLDLDSRQLTTGSVMYWPASGDINFRLEVFGVSKYTSESLRSFTPPPQAPQAAEAKPVNAETPPATDSDKKIVQTRARTKEPADAAEVTLAEPVNTETAEATSVPAEPPPAIEVAALEPSRPKVESRPVVKEAFPIATVAIEPVEESGFRKAVQTIPGLRALQRKYKAGDRFTPAKAIQKVTPTIPAALRKDINGEVPVDLRVSIDEEGNIFRTEVLPGNADNRLLNLAADAAKRWRFEPARIDSKPVSSKVVLHFTFKNPA